MAKKEEQDKDSKENIFSGKKYIRAFGRRKSAIVVAKLYSKGKGDYYMNSKKMDEYLGFPDFIETVKEPLKKVGMESEFDISLNANGGGLKSQAEAARLAIARALLLIDANLKPTLRKSGFVTVDARVKERKKPGLKRARRAPQWAKR